jgi:hypothetical protein
VAKVIEFYVPPNYRKVEKVATKVATEERGQVIEFVPRPRKSA